MTTVDDDVDVTVWPLTGLRVVQGDLELRYLSDDLLHELAAVAGRGVHAPEAMPFTVPWTRGTPVEIRRSMLTYQWGVRSRISPETWSIELAVLRDGIPQGIQGLFATDFAVTRGVTTGSWLGREFQGKGTGTRMRALALHLAFEGFGAQVARTDAFADNPASNAVTRKIGYAPDGTVVLAREGQPVVSQRYRLDRADWEQRGASCGLDLDGIELHGVDPVRRFLAID